MLVTWVYILYTGMYDGPSVIRIPGWSGQFWANYSPVFSIVIIIIIITIIIINEN
jgi:hypothetical protein